jgi:hypothetical protein
MSATSAPAGDPWAGVEKPEKPERDRWGRYRIPHPETGELLSWTRATTFAGSVADRFALNAWQQRMGAIGLAQRPDLLAQVAATHPEDKAQLDRLVEDAKEHAGSTTGAGLGTALHAFTEAVDRGQHPAIPPPHNQDVAAYTNAMGDAGIEVLAVEQVVTVPKLSEPVAGTFDRVVRMPSGEVLVADLKTGKDLGYSWGEIAIQLALYAHAGTVWDPAAGMHLPAHLTSTERALVMHLPVGKASCTLWLVDIAAGWEAAQLCGAVRQWRKRDGLATRLPSPGAPAGGAAASGGAVLAGAPARPAVSAGLPAGLEDKRAWLRDRIVALPPAGGELLATTWPTGVPRLSQATGMGQLDAITAAVNAVEKAVGAPFPEEGDPTHARPGDQRRTGLLDAIKDLPDDMRGDFHDVATALATEPAMTAGEVEAITKLVANAVALQKMRNEATSRAFRVADMSFGVSAAPLLAALGVSDRASAFCDWDCTALDYLVDAIGLGAVAERDGHLVVDRPMDVLDRYGNRNDVLRAGKEAAERLHRPKPKTAADVLEDPVLAAALLMADETPSTQAQGEQAL